MKAIFFFTCVAIVIGSGLVYAMTPSKADKQRTQAIKECVQKSNVTRAAGLVYDVVQADCTIKLK